MDFTNNALDLDLFAGLADAGVDNYGDLLSILNDLTPSESAGTDKAQAPGVEHDHTDHTEHTEASLFLPSVEETRFDASTDVVSQTSMSQEELEELFGPEDDASDAQNDAPTVSTGSPSIESFDESAFSEPSTSTPEPESQEDQLLYPLSAGPTPCIPDAWSFRSQETFAAGPSSVGPLARQTTNHAFPPAPTPQHYQPGPSSTMQGSTSGHFNFSCPLPQQHQHMNYAAHPNPQFAGADESGYICVWDEHGQPKWVHQSALQPISPHEMPQPPLWSNESVFDNAHSGPVHAGYLDATADPSLIGITSSTRNTATAPRPDDQERDPRARSKGKGKAVATNVAGPSRPMIDLPARGQLLPLNVMQRSGLLTPAGSQSSSMTFTPALPFSSPSNLAAGQSSSAHFPSPPNSVLHGPLQGLPQLTIQNQNTGLLTPAHALNQNPFDAIRERRELKRKAIDAAAADLPPDGKPHCAKCKMSFGTKKEYTTHVKSIHTGKSNVVCPNTFVCALRKIKEGQMPDIYCRPDAFRRHYENNPDCRASVEAIAGAPEEHGRGHKMGWSAHRLTKHFHPSLPEWADVLRFLWRIQESSKRQKL